jgi:hypothetical protein
MLKRWLAVCCLIFLTLSTPAAASQPDTQEIIRRSVAATKADMEAAPDFSYVERDVETKSGKSIRATYEVLMIDGSPYYRLIALNDEKLSAEQEAQEQEKLQREIAKRANESPQARAKRLARYRKDQQRELALMSEMADAFDFSLIREDWLEGHGVYVFKATPKPGYQPQTRETRVLKGMQGELWIDKDTYQWVKVEAEAVKPVWFGWFIAKVSPGTRFLLEQEPVLKNLWLPKHFHVDVKASILWVQQNSTKDETYQNYKLISKAPPR